MNKEQQIPILRVDGLKKYYKDTGNGQNSKEKQIRAVDDVSFQIFKGETLGLVGESGCGKSTLAKLIVQLEKPTDGTISFQNQDFSQMDKKEKQDNRTKIQMVFQDPYSSLNPRKTIGDALRDPMIYHKICHKKEVDKEILSLFDRVGLPAGTLDRYPKDFSGGQRQRIGIARALSLKPELLICDEPVSALDVSIQAQILNLLKGIQKELCLSMLFIGHGLSVVQYISDRIAVMYEGKIVEEGDSIQVFQNPTHPYTKTLISSIPILDPALREQRKE